MTADFADSLRTDAHDAPLGDIDYLAAVLNLTESRAEAALSTAATFRLGQSQEHDEAVTAFGGIATLHRWVSEQRTEYVTCDCRDGSHTRGSVVLVTPHERIARAEAAYTAAGHVYPRTVLTLTSPPGEVLL